MTSTTIAPGAVNNGSGALRAPSPPAPGPGSRTRQTASRQRARMVVGLLLLLGCSLAAAVLFANAGDRHAVLVMDRPVAAGEEITAADLGEALVSGDDAASTIRRADADRIVGRFAAVDLVKGSFLAPGHLADGPLAGSDDAVIGATLREGQYPLDLTDGDRVLAVVLPPESALAEDSADEVPVAATVVAVGELSDLGGIAVSLAVRPDDAARVAIAGARGRLALVVVPR